MLCFMLYVRDTKSYVRHAKSAVQARFRAEGRVATFGEKNKTIEGRHSAKHHHSTLTRFLS